MNPFTISAGNLWLICVMIQRSYSRTLNVLQQIVVLSPRRMEGKCRGAIGKRVGVYAKSGELLGNF